MLHVCAPGVPLAISPRASQVKIKHEIPWDQRSTFPWRAQQCWKGNKPLGITLIGDTGLTGKCSPLPMGKSQCTNFSEGGPGSLSTLCFILNGSQTRNKPFYLFASFSAPLSSSVTPFPGIALSNEVLEHTICQRSAFCESRAEESYELGSVV